MVLGPVETLDDHAVCLRAVAERRGLPTDIVFGSRYAVAVRRRPWLRITLGSRHYFFSAGVLLDGAKPVGSSLGSLINGRADVMARDKGVTNEMLRSVGCAVPDGRVFGRDQLSEALAYAGSLNAAVCVKPTTGSYGFLVFPELRSADAIARAFQRVAAKYPRILVEQSIRGVDVRYFFVWPRVVAGVLALPPTVTGDGQRDIAALIAATNEERARRALPGCFPIRIDDDLIDTLGRDGLTLASVPATNRTVVLRHVVNRAVGGECVNPGENLHPSYARVAEVATRVIPGLRISAVDMKVTDPLLPAAPGNHWVLEVNSTPGLLPYHYPWRGAPQDIGGAILDYLQAHQAGECQ